MNFLSRLWWCIPEQIRVRELWSGSWKQADPDTLQVDDPRRKKWVWLVLHYRATTFVYVWAHLTGQRRTNCLNVKQPIKRLTACHSLFVSWCRVRLNRGFIAVTFTDALLFFFVFSHLTAMKRDARHHFCSLQLKLTLTTLWMLTFNQIHHSLHTGEGRSYFLCGPVTDKVTKSNYNGWITGHMVSHFARYTQTQDISSLSRLFWDHCCKAWLLLFI